MGDFTDLRILTSDYSENNYIVPDIPCSDHLKLKLSNDSELHWNNAPCTPTSHHLPKLSIPSLNSSPLATHFTEMNGLQKFLPRNDEENLNMYSYDDFRMFEFKVRRCMRARSHDWTECPFAHPAEKARRRDPRRFHYDATPCSEFRKGSCKKGDACEFSHGVFECWLHPLRYRTQLCKDGRNCKRKVCFFAHSELQLRLLPSLPLSHSLHNFHEMMSPTSTLVGHSKSSFSSLSPPLSPELSPSRTPEPLYSRPFPSHSSPIDFLPFLDTSMPIPHPNSAFCHSHSQPNFNRLGNPLPMMMLPEDMDFHLMQSLHRHHDPYIGHVSPMKHALSQKKLSDFVSSFHAMDLNQQEPYWKNNLKSNFSLEREELSMASRLRNDYSINQFSNQLQFDSHLHRKLVMDEPSLENLPSIWAEPVSSPPDIRLERELHYIKDGGHYDRQFSNGEFQNFQSNENVYNLPDLSNFDWVDKLVQEDAIDSN